MKKREIVIEDINLIRRLDKEGLNFNQIKVRTGYNHPVIKRIIGEQKMEGRFDPAKTYIATCKKTGIVFTDYKNHCGTLSGHILSIYKDLQLPSKIERKDYEYENGVFWHEQYFDITEKEIKPLDSSNIDEEEIIRSYLKNKMTVREIQNTFNVSVSKISNILKMADCYIYIDNPEVGEFKRGDTSKLDELKDKRWAEYSEKIVEKTSSAKKPTEHFFIQCRPARKIKIAVCKKTSEEFKDWENKSGILTLHLREILGAEFNEPTKYIKSQHQFKTGNYWHEQYFNIIEKLEEIEPVFKCRISNCSWVSNDLKNTSGVYTTHLEKEHDLRLEKYIEQYPQDSNLFSTFLNKLANRKELEDNENMQIKCAICGEIMRKIQHSHLKKHNISLKDYGDLYGTTMSEITRQKFVEIGTTNSHNLTDNKKDTVIELIFASILEKLNIQFETQRERLHDEGLYVYDFLIKDDNRELYAEIDGDYWHGHDRKDGWDFKVFNNIIRDFKKSNLVNNNNIVRIAGIDLLEEELLERINSKEDFYNFIKEKNRPIENHPLFHMKDYESIISKKECARQIDIPKVDQELVIKNLLFLWKTFYTPGKYANFVDINARATDTSMLKAIFFEPFYKACKNTNKNLFEIFQGENIDQTLYKIIKYRLGINNAKEFFSITIRNLYKGMEILKMFNVGVFPVKQAKEIYENNVQKEELNIYDPFVGWGSRLFSLNKLMTEKRCKYYGNDINKLLESGYNYILSNLMASNKNLIDLKFESSTILRTELVESIDFIFTSPPFFNDEIYDRSIELFQTRESWVETLLKPVFNNCYAYLKPGSKMIIDMKQVYSEQTLCAAKSAGFIVDDVTFYNVRKSHYNKSDIQKEQVLLCFIKK